MSKSQSPKFAGWKAGDNYVLEKVLGHGSYGEVASAIHVPSSKKVAIKLMRDVFDIPTDVKRAYREMHILRHLRHANIISLVEVMSAMANDTNGVGAGKKKAPRDLGDIYLVFDFVDTDLQKIFKSDQYMSTGHVKYIMYQLLLGMKFMHSANVIHRDIKPANILISCSDCRLKIADFGLARVISTDEMWKRRQPVLLRAESKRKETNSSALGSAISSIFSLASTADRRPSSASTGSMPHPDELLGPGSGLGLGPQDGVDMGARPALRRQLTHHVITRWYRAPEVILSQPYDALVDMWSIGCIFAELFGMIKENIPNYKQRRPIFPGESCGELSPDGTTYETSFHDGDQLNIIFDVLGTPTEEDLKILPPKVAGVINTFRKRSPMNLSAKYPAVDAAGLALLRAMLHFDPSKRAVVDEALHHPFLTEEQSDEKEFDAVCPNPMSADIESLSEENLEHLTDAIASEVHYYQHHPVTL